MYNKTHRPINKIAFSLVRSFAYHIKLKDFLILKHFLLSFRIIFIYQHKKLWQHWPFISLRAFFSWTRKFFQVCPFACPLLSWRTKSVGPFFLPHSTQNIWQICLFISYPRDIIFDWFNEWSEISISTDSVSLLKVFNTLLNVTCTIM